MSSCCGTTGCREQAGEAGRCPECGAKGRGVEAITLKALLRPVALARMAMLPYQFCATPTCPVVYFTGDGDSVFHKEELKVRVGRKEVDDPIPVCYCFEHTRASIREEIEETGESTAGESITAQVRAGRCACEVNNPSGTCCLGEVSKAVKEALSQPTHPVAERAQVPKMGKRHCCDPSEGLG